MKKYWEDNREVVFSILPVVIVWRIILLAPEILGGLFIPLKTSFLGPLLWANFDGVHYIDIASRGYLIYQQAFFPLFPLIIRLVSMLTQVDNVKASILVVLVSFLCMLFFFFKLVKILYDKKIAVWAVVFLLTFPTSFFFISVYTESLFLAFSFASFYFGIKKRFNIASILAMFASATRLVGIFILPALAWEILHTKKKVALRDFAPLLFIPLGLISYMVFLLLKYGDPLLFIHVQEFFAAGRSGGKVIFLPQIMWRYIKILSAFVPSSFIHWIALFEITTFLFVLLIFCLSVKKKIRQSFLIFSFFTLIVPTLSGTLSSFPRYALVSFVVFLFFATIKNKIIKYLILLIGLVLEIVLCSYFLRGYFVS